jgi:hypothetical protein
LDTLLMHHVSLGVIRIVTKRPPEHFRVNQKHVRGSASVVPRIPDAAIVFIWSGFGDDDVNRQSRK